MKYPACVVASVVALSACNKGPTVELHNATTQQVAQAVSKAGVMNSDDMVRPGLWQSKTVVEQMDMPGIPQQYLARMKQSMAEHKGDTSSHCIKPEDVKKPKEDFFGADKSCKYDHFTMGGGKIDIAMVCHQEDTTMNSHVSGTYTPTSYSIDTSMTGSGGHENGMNMKVHVDAQRVGECTGKED
jgi:hypothetical protein